MKLKEAEDIKLKVQDIEEIDRIMYVMSIPDYCMLEFKSFMKDHKNQEIPYIINKDVLKAIYSICEEKKNKIIKEIESI